MMKIKHFLNDIDQDFDKNPRDFRALLAYFGMLQFASQAGYTFTIFVCYSLKITI